MSQDNTNHNSNRDDSININHGMADESTYNRQMLLGPTATVHVPSPQALAIQNFVNSTLFGYCQFVTSQRMMRFGEIIQKTVCQSININPNEAESFWIQEGASITEQCIRRKRQTMATKLKRRFQGMLGRSCYPATRSELTHLVATVPCALQRLLVLRRDNHPHQRVYLDSW